ncbi:MAG: SAM-dependent methyltransferase [Candidatus Cyclobacteriaceae bacterium M3_2C_046]
MKETKEWFGEWFDSPYYHILYKHRDNQEARDFIDNLVDYLKINPEHQILDLACGKGRHAIYLNQKGYQVSGVDLSEQNISFARQFANECLQFDVHDMREVYRVSHFDFILNMFTSFGYFDSKKENEKVVSAAARALKPGGCFMIDFLNPYTVVHNLVPCEQKVIDGIKFQITKSLSADGYILKDIEFGDQGQWFHFQEKVKAIRRSEFMQYFEKAGLQLIDLFGSYQLEEYIAEKSERMIFLLKK